MTPQSTRVMVDLEIDLKNFQWGGCATNSSDSSLSYRSWDQRRETLHCLRGHRAPPDHSLSVPFFGKDNTYTRFHIKSAVLQQNLFEFSRSYKDAAAALHLHDTFENSCTSTLENKNDVTKPPVKQIIFVAWHFLENVCFRCVYVVYQRSVTATRRKKLTIWSIWSLIWSNLGQVGAIVWRYLASPCRSKTPTSSRSGWQPLSNHCKWHTAFDFSFTNGMLNSIVRITSRSFL